MAMVTKGIVSASSKSRLFMFEDHGIETDGLESLAGGWVGPGSTDLGGCRYVSLKLKQPLQFGFGGLLWNWGRSWTVLTQNSS